MPDSFSARPSRPAMLLCALFLLLVTDSSPAQESNSLKRFATFKNLVPGIDFFASARADAAPMEKGLADAREKLVFFFGQDLPKGAIVICTTLEQKDSVNEARMLKMGYRWVLIQVTPEVTAQQTLANIKAQMGGQVPAQILERLQSADMKAMGTSRMVDTVVQKYCTSILVTLLAPDKMFRASRLDDMSRTPIEDWLDISLVAQASGTTKANLRYLQDHMEEAFPLEDVMGGMARPFVPPSTGGNDGGSRMGGGMRGAPSDGAQGGFPGGGGRGGRGGGSMSKDVQDRMMFDLQSATLFDFLAEKLGKDRMRDLVRWNRDGKKTREFITQESQLGPDVEKIEADWQAWVKAQKTEPANRSNPRNQGAGSQWPPQ
jgi:hypothetical protein